MKITIIGWYGTETIGDRAILAGIIQLLNSHFGHISIQLGSLYPFFSNRTIKEDTPFYKKIIGRNIQISLFDSKNIYALNDSILMSDMLIMGGGPLMHIDPIFMVEYAFRFAKKFHKKTILFGTGIGPVNKIKYIKALLNIVKNTDLIILRDSLSEILLKKLIKKYRIYPKNDIKISCDPSIQCLFDFLSLNKTNCCTDQIIVNLREITYEYVSKKQFFQKISVKSLEILREISKKFPKNPILLVPMHYFHIGNDDRDFLNFLKIESKIPNINVQNNILSLTGTMDLFHNAYFNFGMRFHSIIFQTFLNGKNFIIDYTDPGKGKISGFLKGIKSEEFYETRYINIQNDRYSINKLISDLNPEKKFTFFKENIQKILDIYHNSLKDL